MKTLKEKISELINFIYGTRQSEETYWWVGIYDPGNTNPDVLSISLRGYFVRGVWIPMDDEIVEGCCKELVNDIKMNLKQNVTANSLTLMKHCASSEHISKLLASRSTEQIETEYLYMLKVAMNALQNINFGD